MELPQPYHIPHKTALINRDNLRLFENILNPIYM